MFSLFTAEGEFVQNNYKMWNCFCYFSVSLASPVVLLCRPMPGVQSPTTTSEYFETHIRTVKSTVSCALAYWQMNL